LEEIYNLSQAIANKVLFFFFKMNDIIHPVLYRQNAEIPFHPDETEDKYDVDNDGELHLKKEKADLMYYHQVKDDEKLARELLLEIEEAELMEHQHIKDDEKLARELQNQFDEILNLRISKQAEQEKKDAEYARQLMLDN